MQKIIKMLMGTSLVLGLTACGGDSSSNTDPSKLTYTGKTGYVDLQNMTDKTRTDLANTLVEFVTASSMSEFAMIGAQASLMLMAEQMEDLTLTAGAALDVDYKTIVNDDPEYTFCGGTGALAVSNDFVQDNDAIKSFAEVRASAGSLSWKLDNFCVEASEDGIKQTLTAQVKESYQANANTTTVQADYHHVMPDSIDQKCKVDMVFTQAVGLTPEEEDTSYDISYQCRELSANFNMMAEEAVLKLNSGETAFFSGSDDATYLSSYGKLDFDVRDIDGFCYDSSAKVHRIKQGEFEMMAYVYDAEAEKYVEDYTQMYLIEVEQKDPAKCGKPLVTVTKYLPE